MTYSQIPAVAFIGLSFLGAGCLADGQPAEEDVDGQIGTSEEAVISSNRLSLNRLSLNGLRLKALSTAALSTDGVRVANTDLLQRADGREPLAYAIRCALPDGAQLRARRGPKTYVFQGHMGLAPEWQRAPLGQSGQRWVTACLLAHANGYGIEVPVPLRGPKQALQVTPDEKQSFSVQEASFYGNVFTSPDNAGQRPLYACAGEGIQAAGAIGPGGQYSPLRACSPHEQCQLRMPGACFDFTRAKKDACGEVTQQGYSQCHSKVAPRQSQGGQDEQGGQLGQPDQGQPDQGQPDQGRPDQRQPDQGQPDQRQPDQGQPDQGQPDQGQPDQGQPNQGQPNQFNPSQFNPSPQSEEPEPGAPGPFDPGSFDQGDQRQQPGQEGPSGQSGQGNRSPGSQQFQQQYNEVITVYLKPSSFQQFYGR